MDLLLKAMIEDIWIVAPILLCSFLTLGVVINRLYYYNKNKRDVVLFIPKLQKELARNNLDSAQNLSVQLGGIVGTAASAPARTCSRRWRSARTLCSSAARSCRWSTATARRAWQPTLKRSAASCATRWPCAACTRSTRSRATACA